MSQQKNHRIREELGFCHGGQDSGLTLVFPANVLAHHWVSNDGKRHDYVRTDRFTRDGIRIFREE